MKTYNINIHFDAAITLHGIVADIMAQALYNYYIA